MTWRATSGHRIVESAPSRLPGGAGEPRRSPRDFDGNGKLDLARPSICFHVDDLEAARAELVARGVNATEVGEHHGMRNFAFSDPEACWFAVTR